MWVLNCLAESSVTKKRGVNQVMPILALECLSDLSLCMVSSSRKMSLDGEL